ncbi:MAG TPA: hypothetical protein VMI54_29355 [Polyangiaceae bacterium]|nr:hypothetical protein [Polyangiaceae bacterium]
MTFVTRRRGYAVLPSLSLLLACSTGVAPDPNGTPAGGTGGTSTTTGGTSGTAAQGGSSANGGSSATSGASGSSATGGATGSGATGGSSATGGTNSATGGSSATGGASGAGGSSATGGTGGDSSATGGSAGSAATGGTSSGGSAGMTGTGGTDPGICQQLSVVPTAQVPTIELLVDTSSSMFETMPTSWSVLYNALMDPTTSPVKALQSKINFGYASYKGHQGTSETDMACATMTTVAPAPNNYSAIDAVYQMVGMSYDPTMPPMPKWETPTNYAISYAAQILTNYMPPTPGKKYILLVTDGNPNTCETIDPQCGQDYAIKAAQDAYAAGIGLLVLGVGDIVKDPNSGCPTSARCGAEALQDMADAGVGAPVTAPPGCDDPTSTGCQFKYEQCNKGNMLTASYGTGTSMPGTPYEVDTTASDADTQLAMAFTNLLSDVPCAIDMDAIVTGDPSLGDVEVGTTKETYNDPNGWTLDPDAYTVILQGKACTDFRSGLEVNISFPCDPSGNPIAVHR